MKQHIHILVVILILLGLSPAGAQTIKLRLGTTAATSTEKVAFALAKDAGILKKHDLDLEVILITSGGTLAMQALVGKSIDILTTGATPFLHGYLEGAEVKFIAGVNNKFIYSFMTRGSITNGAQLKGKVVGITRFGSIDELATKTALTQLGLNPRTDVKIIQVGGSASRLAALQSGSIEATSLASGYSYVGQKLGLNVLIDFVEKDIEYMMTGVVARTEILKARGDAVRRFLRAYLEGIRYYKSHREEAIKKTMEAIRTDDRGIAETDYTYRARALPDDGKPTVKGTQWAIDELAKENPKAKNLTPAQIFDLSYLP
ncbi:MAG TPA: ABC transporter substrate-binding protein [Terriglobales bacterium]|nr:ABC transporter substrate-binding protein [Terriglobales bacterium]